MWNQIKTVLLLGGLSGLILLAGRIIGGQEGLLIALFFAVIMNFGMYFFSHKFVLTMYRAQIARKGEHPELHRMIEELAKKMHLPKPALYIIPTATPNAFATGPSPKKAVVAVTQGITDILTPQELHAVLAHEMGHIKNRDILITTLAATLAAVISFIAQTAQFAAVFGTRDEDSAGLLGTLFLALLAPIIALIIQLAISRSREYLADETGARAIGNGKALASALQKLEHGVRARPLRFGNTTTSSLFIVNPFTAQGITALFSTHPPTRERIKRLEGLKL